MIKIGAFISCLLISSKMLIADVVSTSQFCDLLAHVDQLPNKTVVFCDIDNTLIMPKSYFGSVFWADDLIKELRKKGLSKEESESVEYILWKTVQPSLEMRLVDHRIPEVIHQLNSRGIPVIGLTARFPENSEFTLKQFESVGLCLSFQDSNLQQNREFLLKTPVEYVNGVIFAGMINKKSAALIEFLKDFEGIEYVVFVDDKRHHVEDVEKGCRQQGIQCLGIHFTGADDHSEKFAHAPEETAWELFFLER